MEFYFNPVQYAFIEGFEKAFLDKYEAELTAVPEADDGEVYVDIRDIKRIFSPELQVNSDAEGLTLQSPTATLIFRCGQGYWQVDGTAKQPKGLPKQTADGWRLPACTVMGDGFGYAIWMQRPYFRIARDVEKAEMTLHEGEHYRNVMRGKRIGELYKTIWNENMQKLLPYRLYIPTYVDERKDFPLIIGLHGGKGSPDSVFDKTDRKFSFYAEEMGFILMAPDACIENSTYGCSVPPQGADTSKIGFTGSEQELWEKRVSEEALYEEITYVRDHWPVNPDRIYLMGNSMGGIGTFYFASQHPELFRAISPAGAAPTADRFDSTGLAGLRIHLVAGTEDFHGYDQICKAYRVFKERGLDITMRAVGGGTHPSAWIDVLEETLKILLAK